MPVIFIHGVNTRYDKDYVKDVAARNELIQRLVLAPLADKYPRLKQIEIVSPYWGEHGVDFAWNQASVPDVSVLEGLGGGTSGTPKSDLEIMETLKELQATSQGTTSPLESLGANDNPLKTAATKDLVRFIEAMLMPLILSEMNLLSEIENIPEKPQLEDKYRGQQENALKKEGRLEALLSVASLEVATDPDVKKEVAKASSDEEVIKLLKKKIQTRFEKLVSPPDTAPTEGGLESLGPGELENLKDRIGEIFDRTFNAPKRLATVAALDQFREGLHSDLSQFLGDVFVYLNERGGKNEPGPIVSAVLHDIREAIKSKPNDEPLIIITHSMGGNILYDILTYYAPELKVDVWVSVGGQVGQFEEMKLFKNSNKEIRGPKKVAGLKPVGYWLNVYDPADVLSFKVAPIFDAVDQDKKFLTGASALKSHGAYFKRPSFYRMLREHIEEALS